MLFVVAYTCYMSKPSFVQTQADALYPCYGVNDDLVTFHQLTLIPHCFCYSQQISLIKVGLPG